MQGGGDGWVFVVEFSKPLKAYSVLAYGETQNPIEAQHGPGRAVCESLVQESAVYGSGDQSESREVLSSGSVIRLRFEIAAAGHHADIDISNLRPLVNSYPKPSSGASRWPVVYRPCALRSGWGSL